MEAKLVLLVSFPMKFICTCNDISVGELVFSFLTCFTTAKWTSLQLSLLCCPECLFLYFWLDSTLSKGPLLSEYARNKTMKLLKNDNREELGISLDPNLHWTKGMCEWYCDSPLKNEEKVQWCSPVAWEHAETCAYTPTHLHTVVGIIKVPYSLLHWITDHQFS